MDHATPTKGHLASLMRVFRAHHSLNAAEAGAYLGLSPRTVEGIEQGRGYSSAQVLAIALVMLTAEKKLRDPVDYIR